MIGALIFIAALAGLLLWHCRRSIKREWSQKDTEDMAEELECLRREDGDDHS